MLNALALFLSNTPELVDTVIASSAGTTSDWIIDISGADIEPGDKVVAIFGAGTTPQNLSYRIAGFTEKLDLYEDSSFDCNLQVGVKEMSDPVDTSITITDGNGSSGASSALIVQVWRKAEGIGTVTSATEASVSGDANPPSISVVRGGVPIIVCGVTGHGRGSEQFTNSELLSFVSVPEIDNVDVTLGAGYLLSDGSTIDPAAFVFDDAASGGQHSWCSACLALDGG